jgi:hypothetical protein
VIILSLKGMAMGKEAIDENNRNPEEPTHEPLRGISLPRRIDERAEDDRMPGNVW